MFNNTKRIFKGLAKTTIVGSATVGLAFAAGSLINEKIKSDSVVAIGIAKGDKQMAASLMKSNKSNSVLTRIALDGTNLYNDLHSRLFNYKGDSLNIIKNHIEDASKEWEASKVESINKKESAFSLNAILSNGFGINVKASSSHSVVNYYKNFIAVVDIDTISDKTGLYLFSDYIGKLTKNNESLKNYLYDLPKFEEAKKYFMETNPSVLVKYQLRDNSDSLMSTHSSNDASIEKQVAEFANSKASVVQTQSL